MSGIITGLIGFIVFLGFLAFAVILIVRQARKDRQLKRRLAESLGFHPLENLSGELSERITTVHRHPGSGRFTLRNVFSRTLPEGEFYLYDLWETGSESSSRLEQCAFAVVSPGAHLPHFSIFPRVDASGGIGNLANRLVTWVMSRFATEIRLEHPEFQERYLLVGEDESAVRAALTPDLLDHLSRSPLLILSAGGDTFSVSTLDLRGGRKKPDLESVSALYNQAIQLSSYLFH
jgi:hypothetical protein